jgi:hypothetical protein
MTDFITTDAKQAKEAYDRGEEIRVDRVSNPMRFSIGGPLMSGGLDYRYGGDWWLITAQDAAKYFPKTTPTQINTIGDLAAFIQSGGGDCHVGSMTFDRETALKHQASGSSIIWDLKDPDRYAVSDPMHSFDFYDELLGGDWRRCDPATFKPQPQLVNFFASLSNPDAHRYDVKNFRVMLADPRARDTLNHEYGGDWKDFSGLTSQDIAKFAAKAKEQDIEIN